MRVLLQRSKFSNVTVEGKIVGKIGQGLTLLVGFTHTDSFDTINKMVDKVINLRVFDDENGLMNLSVLDISGDILCVSQFTLYACNNGRRPSFTEAMEYGKSFKLYEEFCNLLKLKVSHVEKGIFGADMLVNINNDGPVTIMLEI